MTPLATDVLDRIWEESTRDKMPVGSELRSMVAEIRRWRGEAWAASQRASSPDASPDSGEALIDNAARALYLAYAQHPEARWDAVDPAMQEGVWRAHIRAVQAGTIRVTPSPEAPANRQEAGQP